MDDDAGRPEAAVGYAALAAVAVFLLLGALCLLAWASGGAAWLGWP